MSPQDANEQGQNEEETSAAGFPLSNTDVTTATLPAVPSGAVAEAASLLLRPEHPLLAAVPVQHRGLIVDGRCLSIAYRFLGQFTTWHDVHQQVKDLSCNLREHRLNGRLIVFCCRSRKAQPRHLILKCRHEDLTGEEQRMGPLEVCRIRLFIVVMGRRDFRLYAEGFSLHAKNCLANLM
jgi:hypothetical protein